MASDMKKCQLIGVVNQEKSLKNFIYERFEGWKGNRHNQE